MPKLHIIYDPKDMLSHSADQVRVARLKIAILDIANADDLGNREIKDIVTELGTLLLEQVRIAGA